MPYSPSFSYSTQTLLYWAFGPGHEGSFLCMQWRQGAAKTSRMDVGGEDKAIGSSFEMFRRWARSLGCNVQYAVPGQVQQPGKRERLLGFPPWVSQPAALCGILEGIVLWCDRALANALYRNTGLQNTNALLKKKRGLITSKALVSGAHGNSVNSLSEILFLYLYQNFLNKHSNITIFHWFI